MIATNVQIATAIVLMRAVPGNWTHAMESAARYRIYPAMRLAIVRFNSDYARHYMVAESSV